jgi:hypothetical protein
MTMTRTWRHLLRLCVVVALFSLSTGPVLAHQDGLKDIQDEEGASALEYPGLVGEGEYVSPQFDLDITWSGEWVVGEPDDPLIEHAIGGYWDGPVATEPDVGDIVFLVDSDTGTSVLSLGFSYLSPTISIDDVVAYMETPEYLVNNLFLSEGAEILALDASRDSVAVVARDSAPNQDHVIYQMMVLDPEDEDFGFWVGLDMYDPDHYQPIIESIDAGIEVEDNEIFSVLDAGQVLEAAQSDASGAEEADSTGYENAGSRTPLLSATWMVPALPPTRPVNAARTIPPVTPFPGAALTAAIPPSPAPPPAGQR